MSNIDEIMKKQLIQMIKLRCLFFIYFLNFKEFMLCYLDAVNKYLKSFDQERILITTNRNKFHFFEAILVFDFKDLRIQLICIFIQQIQIFIQQIQTYFCQQMSSQEQKAMKQPNQSGDIEEEQMQQINQQQLNDDNNGVNQQSINHQQQVNNNQMLAENQEAQQQQQQHQAPAQNTHNPISQAQNNQQIQNQQQQEQEGELPPSNQNIQPQNQNSVQDNQGKQKNTLKQQALKDKDTYINKLQIYLNKVKNDLNIKNNQFQELSQQNKKNKESLKKLRFDFLSTKQQLSTKNEQYTQLQKENQTLTLSNTHLNEQLQTYKQAGDINFYKNKITELQKLLQIQKKQLQLKTVMVDEKDQLQNSFSNSQKNKLQVLNLLQKYQKQNLQLTQKYKDLSNSYSQIQSANKTYQLKIQEYQKQLTLASEALIVEKQKFTQLQNQLKNHEQDSQKRIKQLQENIEQLIVSQQNQKQINQLTFSSKKILKSPQQQYGIKILTPIQERNMIMTEYIELQIKYQSLNQELVALRERHYNTLREIKNISASHVPKKDFSELYKKYVKLRKCLENSLLNEENLRKELNKFAQNKNDQISNQQQNQEKQKDQAQSQAFSKYRSLVLQQPENQVKKIDKIIQKSGDSQKQLFSLKQQLQTKHKLIRSQKQMKQKDQKLKILENEKQKLQSLNSLYETEIKYKNDEIVLLRKANQQSFEKIIQLERNFISKAEQQKLNGYVEQKNLVNQILQIKNIQALKQNAILRSEKENLTELYNDLKNMYEDLINRQPQLQSQQNTQQKPKQSSSMEIQHSKPCKQCQEREQKLKAFAFSQVQTQTEGLSQIYFKQIKELLTILRKFPKKVDSITGVLEAEKSTIHEVKKRYDQVMQAYGAKYRQLEEQKKANDQWRLKQRDQIREEFQQIRDMLLNERLIGALRKAKSLIQSYEQNNPEGEGDQNIEEGEQQEAIQKPIGEEQIEQEQKNV